ncbi:hypothetical protein [Legionella jamestowniensis]|uniref:Uncharacterized protein n=1 Tax=Legionella jamestowniensis TaxID=455 RepID=A0A0W0ULC0_9GAMM|nr:hypothetical protein [Legionella jamestowniensis]KTD08597.1 hypothetical protein Ljam_2792 [Legionella jamestowniensis]OCH96952.1 hypothetical protein A8135_04760 [Legionella jamestowniensis]SFL53387.1 hypothetical protein SAMN02746073_0741 [Legionella jamestowniensis DSM 19215]
MTAIITNAWTNALHALFLFFYFLIAAIQWLKGNSKFTLYIVIFFLTIFVLKLLGVWVHYAFDQSYTVKIWIAISLGVVFLNYCLIHAIRISDPIRISVLLISLIFTFFYLNKHDFLYIALSVIFIYSLAAAYSKGLVRLGFIAVIASNIIWIGLREGTNLILGYELPVQYRYDNDLYHLLLIGSTYIIFVAIMRGDWSYP